MDNLAIVSVLDSESNMSDHCILGFKASLSHLVHVPVPINSAVPCIIVHNWSPSNQNMYYANASLPLLNLYFNSFSCDATTCTNIDCALDNHISDFESLCNNLAKFLKSLY